MECMHEGWDDGVRRGMVDMEYYDEQAWKKLDPVLVEQCEKAGLDRFQHIVVYEYLAQNDSRA